LVCHISNFELKPLHKYFDNNTPIEHKKLNKEALEEYKNKKEVLKKNNDWHLGGWRLSIA
jgi:hypothetical protein